MEKTHDYLLALGRVLMSGLFVWGGYEKLMAPGATTQYFAQAGVPLPGVMVWVAILVELVGGIVLLVGFKNSVGRRVVGHLVSHHGICGSLGSGRQRR